MIVCFPCYNFDQKDEGERAAEVCRGELVLYSSTHHRGEVVRLSEATEHLGNFSNQAVSAKVVGACCWQVDCFILDCYRLFNIAGLLQAKLSWLGASVGAATREELHQPGQPRAALEEYRVS